MLSPDTLLAAWERASTADENGFHDGAGFAMNNWKAIQDTLRMLILSS